jgi:hypothetical protein
VADKDEGFGGANGPSVVSGAEVCGKTGEDLDLYGRLIDIAGNTLVEVSGADIMGRARSVGTYFCDFPVPRRS